MLFYSTEEPAASAPKLVRSSRGRAVIGRAASQPIVLRVVESGECVSVTENWELAREGFFAMIRRENDSPIDAFFENAVIFLRISRPGEKTIRGALVQAEPGHYFGRLTMNTSCGVKSVWVDARVQQ
jgi:hypothetical protein